jgi:putative sterol carrier protein
VSIFLSEAWTQDVTMAINNHEGYRKALGSAEFTMQFVVDEGTDSQVDYYVSTGDGKAVVDLGNLDNADVTVKQSYETAAAIFRGDLNTITALMTGKLKVSGNIVKVMLHQNVLAQWSPAVADLDVEY